MMEHTDSNTWVLQLCVQGLKPSVSITEKVLSYFTENKL